MPQRFTDDEFIAAWRRLQSATKVGALFGIDVRSIHQRRRNLEEKLGISLPSKAAKPIGGPKNEQGGRLSELADFRARHYEADIELEVTDGIVLVGSDAHYWPLIVSVAHQAFCELARRLKPKLVILNGDILDGARITRHARIMWEQQPKLRDELSALQDRCAEIERAAGKAQLVRTIGNHDARFETYLSGSAPELEETTGSTLLDYLPRWRAGWAVHLNRGTPGWTAIRHRPVSGGIHSAYNSTLRSGVHYVHGHLHKLQITPWGDYRGRRYGIDTGTLAEVDGPQFSYAERAPMNWAAGFAVLSFEAGVLLEPELCVVQGARAVFRGARL